MSIDPNQTSVDSDVAAPPPTVEQLTASGRGAVAVIRLVCSAECDRSIIDRFFCPIAGRPSSEAVLNRIRFGAWENEDVVVVRVSDDAWEIYCHGGDVAVSRLMSQLTFAGAIDITTSGSGQRRRTLESDLQEQLLNARTTRTAALILAQQQGLLRSRIQELAVLPTVETLRREVESLLSWQQVCKHLTEPWSVAVAGRPNAGKSSVLNRIVGFERAIVFDQPGTTRDLVEATTFLNEWPFQFVDTAGIRDSTADAVEAIGIASARGAVSVADACLLVVDAAIGWTQEDEQLWQSVDNQTPTAVLLNKCDRAEANSTAVPEHITNIQPAVFKTSAKLDEGIDPVTEWLFNQLIPTEPDVRTVLPATQAVRSCFRRVLDGCEAARPLESLRQELLNLLD